MRLIPRAILLGFRSETRASGSQHLCEREKKKKEKRANSRVPACRVNFRNRTDVPHKRPVSLPKISHACVRTPATSPLHSSTLHSSTPLPYSPLLSSPLLSSPHDSRHVRRRRRQEPSCANERLLTYLSAARAGIFLFFLLRFFFPSYLGISRRLLALLLVYSCRLSSFIKNSVSGAGRGGGAFRERSRQAARESSSPSCQVGLLLASPLGARKARRKRRRDKERGRRWRSVLEK